LLSCMAGLDLQIRNWPRKQKMNHFTHSRVHSNGGKR
jgi:hypothetical protein